MASSFKIGGSTVGADHATYFIADIAANHDGNLERAKDLIHRCAEAGADAAKFQNFQAATIVSDYGFKSLGEQQSHQAKWKKSVYEVYQAASLPLEWTQELKKACDEAGIDYFTTPYDLDIVDHLNPYVCAWKVGSGDITWHANIERLARCGKPIMIATGAAEMAEVEAAVSVAERFADDIVIMQCNTDYTGSAENFRHIALNVLKSYSRKWPQHVLGLSDHTPGHATVLGAVTLGARVVEKHFTDDNHRDGPDHVFSMNPASWRDMVDRTRELEFALGSENKRIMDNEQQTVVLQRRAVRAAHALPSGHRISESDLVSLRPCPRDAVPPYRAGELIGKTTRRAITSGDLVRFSDCE